MQWTIRHSELQNVSTSSGTNSASSFNQQVMEAVSLEAKGPGCEALQSPSSCAEIKKERRHTSTLRMCRNGEYRKKFAPFAHQMK
jgi:hypothetical protein